MRIAFLALAPLLTAVAAAPFAYAAAPQSHDPTINPPPAERCFEIGQISRYHGDGDRALVLRTDNDRYYRLSFAGQCPNVVRPDASVVFKQRGGGGGEICNPIDLEVTVIASRFPQTCGVDAIQPMTAEEVRALPAKNRP